MGEAASSCGDLPIRDTNDLTLDADGGFYFTDPGNFRAGGIELERGKVCYVDAEGTSHLVAQNLGFPNGLVLRPDGRTLLVSESLRNRVLAFPVVTPGVVGAATEFAQLPAGPEGGLVAPDGMALAENGDLYVAHYGTGQIRVLDREGALVRSLPAGNRAVSNVAFGGENRDQLFVTGRALGSEPEGPGIIYRLDLPGVRGLSTTPP